MTAVLRLVLADDHEVTRTGFVALLAGHPQFDVVGQACARPCNGSRAARRRSTVRSAPACCGA